MNKISIALLGIVAAFTYGCAAPDPGATDERVSTQESEWSAGCYWDCPDCRGHNCSLCSLVCADGVVCGDSRCMADEVCCNEPCGICAKPGAVCDRHSCEQPPECSNDSQCMLTADYCAQCDCVAHSVEKDLPACGGPGVQCYVDPCLSRNAVCKSGRCSLE